MTTPSLSKHLKILEAVGLVKADKRGRFVFYSLQKDSLTSFVQQVCPVSTKLRKESKAIAATKAPRPR